MSHFTVLVIGNDPEKQLAPFSERIDVPEYLAEKVEQEEIDRFLKYYRTKSDDLSGYYATKNKSLDFDAIYSIHGEDWNDRAWKYDNKGQLGRYSTYNPESRWDWYVLGGRWDGELKTEHGELNQAKKTDILNWDELKPFSILKDGKWYQKGEMLWFAVVKDEKAEWPNEVQEIKRDVEDDTLISMYDCHI